MGNQPAASSLLRWSVQGKPWAVSPGHRVTGSFGGLRRRYQGCGCQKKGKRQKQIITIIMVDFYTAPTPS